MGFGFRVLGSRICAWVQGLGFWGLEGPNLAARQGKTLFMTTTGNIEGLLTLYSYRHHPVFRHLPKCGRRYLAVDMRCALGGLDALVA